MKNYKQELENMLDLRLKNVERLYALDMESQKTKEYIAKEELEVKIDFNRRVDSKDPMYSNAEKRKVALQNELENDTKINSAKEDLEEQERRLLQEKLHETRLKLMERYLFKEIDLETGK